MSGPSRRVWTCARCLQSQKVRGTSTPAIVHPSTFLRRSFSIIPPLQDENPTSPNTAKDRNDPNDDNKEQGAMSRRLADMAEETMESGSKSDQKLMKEVFSDELKKQLEERIAQTSFSSQNQRAASQVNMPVRWKHPSPVILPQALSLTPSLPPTGRCRQRNTRHCRSRSMDRLRVSTRRSVKNVRRQP